MNNNTLLISYKTLVQSSVLNENIDTKIILPLIKEVQEMEVEPIIGTALFEKLKTGIEDNNLTDDYKYLLNEVIKPVMINGILTDIPFMNYRFTNVGTVERTSENASKVDAKEIQKLSDYYKAKVKWYAGKLSAYLCKNEDKFEEYTQSQPDDEAPTEATYSPGIYLG